MNNVMGPWFRSGLRPAQKEAVHMHRFFFFRRVAVKDFKLSYHSPNTRLFTTYPQYGNLRQVPAPRDLKDQASAFSQSLLWVAGSQTACATKCARVLHGPGDILGLTDSYRYVP